jgi:hypothetical protein
LAGFSATGHQQSTYEHQEDEQSVFSSFHFIPMEDAWSGHRYSV